MGIGIVLLLGAIVGMIAAGIGAILLGGIAAWLTRGVEHGRKKVILIACLFPFACLGWATITFIFQAIVNETVLHRDAGIGDAFSCPLPNGYQILMIDVTDVGYVYNPKTQTSSYGVSSQEDAPSEVRVLQLEGRYILGGIDTCYYDHFGTSTHLDSYFILDTQRGKRTDFADRKALSHAAQKLGIQLNLEPISDIYARFRFTWFDVFAGLLLIIPPILGFIFLARSIIRLRRKPTAMPEGTVTDVDY